MDYTVEVIQFRDVCTEWRDSVNDNFRITFSKHKGGGYDIRERVICKFVFRTGEWYGYPHGINIKSWEKNGTTRKVASYFHNGKKIKVMSYFNGGCMNDPDFI